MGRDRTSSDKSKAPRRKRQAAPRAGDEKPAPVLSKPARRALDQFKLENVVSHLLRRAHFAAEDVFALEFSAEAITPRQKGALVVVYQRPGINQNELAELLFMDRNTVAEMVSRLCARTLLKRSPAAGDRRAYQLFLAPKGASLLDRIIVRDAKVERKIISKLPRKDRASFTRCLRLLTQLR